MSEKGETELHESPLQRAMREACEQEAERQAHEEQVAAKLAQVPNAREPAPEVRTVVLQLVLRYTPSGRLANADGLCSGRLVLTAASPESVGQVAEETLRLAALGALLGSP